MLYAVKWDTFQLTGQGFWCFTIHYSRAKETARSKWTMIYRTRLLETFIFAAYSKKNKSEINKSARCASLSWAVLTWLCIFLMILFQTLFELITSEASYLKSLNILISNFLEAPELSDNYLIDKRDKHVLFSNATAVRDVSSRYISYAWFERNFLSNFFNIDKFSNTYVLDTILFNNTLSPTLYWLL